MVSGSTLFSSPTGADWFCVSSAVRSLHGEWQKKFSESWQGQERERHEPNSESFSGAVRAGVDFAGGSRRNALLILPITRLYPVADRKTRPHVSTVWTR